MTTAVEVAAEIGAAIRVLARHRCGALLVWNPATHVEGGIVIDAAVTRQLLVAVFAADPVSGLRAGLAVLRDGRVERAAVPLAWSAATELAANAAIAVNEETGEIRLLLRGRPVEVVDAFALATELHRHALASGLR